MNGLISVTSQGNICQGCQGSKLGGAGCREPGAPLNSPGAPSNFCREPKDVLVSIRNTFTYLLKMQLGS